MKTGNRLEKRLDDLFTEVGFPGVAPTAVPRIMDIVRDELAALLAEQVRLGRRFSAWLGGESDEGSLQGDMPAVITTPAATREKPRVAVIKSAPASRRVAPMGIATERIVGALRNAGQPVSRPVLIAGLRSGDGSDAKLREREDNTNRAALRRLLAEGVVEMTGGSVRLREIQASARREHRPSSA